MLLQSTTHNTIQYSDVFQAINDKIALDTTRLMNKYIYGIEQDCSTIGDLLEYKDILEASLRCDSCVSGFSTQQIISKIFKLI